MTPRARREVLAVDPEPESAPGEGADPGERVVDPAASSGAEEAEEVGLRPRSLSEFLGQPELVEHLGDVMSMYAFHIEADHATPVHGVKRSNHSHASVEGQIETPKRVFGEVVLVGGNVVHAESFEVANGRVPSAGEGRP